MMRSSPDSKENPIVPLSMVLPGKQVRLARVGAGRGLVARLTAMGLVPGVTLRVVNNTGVGPFVAAVHNSRIVLGRGVVHRIYVTLL